MKRILITNDDGIESEGIIRLARTAKDFGEVWVVAPDGQRSAASHSIIIRGHLDVRPHAFPVEGVRAYACSGTPADCARVGIRYLMDSAPDILLSGINLGYNMGVDIQYSGTVGAAFEADRFGIPAIALSESHGEDHRIGDRYLAEVLRMLMDRRLEPGQVYNVNFPDCGPEECRGILENRTVSRDSMYQDRYIETEKLPEGGFRLAVNGIFSMKCKEGTDFHALINNYISIGVLNNIC